MNYSETILETDGPERDLVKSQIQEDFAKADIYFQSLNVQTIAQERKYTVQPSTDPRKKWALGCVNLPHMSRCGL